MCDSGGAEIGGGLPPISHRSVGLYRSMGLKFLGLFTGFLNLGLKFMGLFLGLMFVWRI